MLLHVCNSMSIGLLNFGPHSEHHVSAAGWSGSSSHGGSSSEVRLPVLPFLKLQWHCFAQIPSIRMAGDQSTFFAALEGGNHLGPGAAKISARSRVAVGVRGGSRQGFLRVLPESGQN